MSRRALLAWTLLVAASIGACSWLVDPLDGPLRCSLDAGTNVCPRGLTCQAGECRVFCNQEGIEVCNDNVDNDCDDKTDEPDPLGRDTCGDGKDNDCDGLFDEDSDRDKDGFAACGDTSKPGSTPPDCDDDRSEVNPNALEICDNLDNNCNGKTDDPPPGGSLCPTGEQCDNGRCIRPTCASGDPRFACIAGTVCSPERGVCEAVPVGCADVKCDEGYECDASTRECRPKPKKANGSACIVDSDCSSGACFDGAALRLASPPRVCGQACCGDDGCRTPGERCFASGTGARSCLPVSMFPIAEAKQCASDRACGMDLQCGLENSLRLMAPTYTPTAQLTTGLCRPTPDNGEALGQYCLSISPQGCTSRTCVPAALGGFVCSMPCGRSDDCAAFDRTAPFRSSYCRYVQVHAADGARKPDYAGVCVIRREGETGSKLAGEECSTAQECRDRGCVGATADGKKGLCLTTCCDNGHCGPNEGSERGTCRPFVVGMGYEMRCEPPPSPPSAQPR